MKPRILRCAVYCAMLIMAFFLFTFDVTPVRVYASRFGLLITEGAFRLLSHSTDGEIGNGSSENEDSSTDGRIIAFESSASNLVAGDTNGVRDVFVVDLEGETIERISVNANSQEGDADSVLPKVSSDGRYVVFASLASNLVEGNASGVLDLFLVDRQHDTIQRITNAVGGGVSNGNSFAFEFSADDRYVLFSSAASNLVSDDTNGVTDIFLYDILTASIEKIAITPAGVEPDRDSDLACMSADQRFIVFTSYATNLVANDTNNDSDVFLLDRDAQTVKLISKALDGNPAGGGSQLGDISADSQFIVFKSYASNLVDGDVNNNNDVFLYNRASEQISMITSPTQEIDKNIPRGDAISSDGRFVALALGYYGSQSNVYVYDRVTGVLNNFTYTGYGFVGGISENGQWIVFHDYGTVINGYPSTQGQVYRYEQDPVTLAKPTLVMPTHQVEMMTAPELFTWYPLAGATSYKVEIKKSEDNSVVLSQTVDAGTSCDLSLCYLPFSQNLAAGEYQWRVYGVNQVGNGPWSDTNTFTFTPDSSTCYSLALSHDGNGVDPTANPAQSEGCNPGEYVEGETITLSGADADDGWEISGWSGTSDNTSKANTNILFMPAAAHEARVSYTEISPVIVRTVSAGNFYSCVLTSVGGVQCWGYNYFGQLGDGTTIDRSAPVNVVGLEGGVVAISAGGLHTCALTAEGGVKCWGLNSSGQLGDGTTTDRATPVDVVGLSSGVAAISVGGLHTCALTTEGGVKCWGYNGAGRLGDGTTIDRTTPVDVLGLTSGVKDISAGVTHTCALTSAGGVQCWGENNNGQVGDGTTSYQIAPVGVVGLESGISAISESMEHTCVVKNDGGVKCWGLNQHGQLGDGTTIDRTTPVDVVGLEADVSGISVGSDHSCVLTYNGDTYCWGGNAKGQLGDGTTEDHATPSDMPVLVSGVSAISAGNYHACALTSDGEVQCWGSNVAGQLGDGTTAYRFSPVNVVGYGGSLPCYPLVLGHDGNGSDPETNLTQSPGCNAGEYVEGEIIVLSGAIPETGWGIGGWNGTDNDANLADNNTVTMPAAAHEVKIIYGELPTIPTQVGPVEGTILARENDTKLEWATTGISCSVHVWGGDVDVTSEGSCANYALGVQPGGEYTWQVTATNMYGSVIGAEWHFDLQPHGITELQGTVASATQVNLSWTLSTDDPANIDGYDIYKDGTLVNSVAAGVNTYSATGLACNTNYSYVVRARHETVQSDDSALLEVKAPCVPGSFNKSAPSNNTTTLIEPIQTLKWTTSSDAASYEYCVDTTNDNVCKNNAWVSAGANLSVDLAAGTLKSNTVYYWQVRAINASGIRYANTNSWWAFKTLPIPSAPVLIAPKTGLITNNPTPAFSWGTVVRGDVYQLEISDSTTFSAKVQTFTGEAGIVAYTASTLTDGTYYWRVRAINKNGEAGAWSIAYKLIIDTQAPPIPTLSGPKDNSFTTSRTPTLSVVASSGASKYQYQVSVDPEFGSAAVDVSTTATSYLLATAQKLNYGTYYWRARAIDVAGNVSAWSAANRFGVVFQSAPTNNGYLITSKPTFSWTAVSGALEYHLQAANTETFDELVIDQYQTTGTSYISPVLDYGVYYWRMQVRTTSGWSAWAPAWKTTLTPPLTPAPVLASPANGALTADNTVTLSWKLVSEDDRYEVQVDNGSAFTSLEATHIGEVGELTYTTSSLADGTCYWRVRSVNYLGVAGTWSSYRSVKVDTKAPTAPVLSVPSHGKTMTGTPTFTWLSASTAVMYQFEYANDSNFESPIYTSAELNTLSHKPPTIASGTYFWHVRAKDSAGNWSAWSTARTVIILVSVPAAPALSTPANSLTLNDSTPDFSWGSVAYVNTYELQISKSTTFTTKEQTFIGGVDVRVFTAETLLDGTYYWRVRALNENNAAGAWSSYRSFKVDTTAPVAPVLSLPGDAKTNTGTPTFTWLSASTAVKYQFEYDNESSFESPIYTSVELTTLSHKPPTIAPGTYFWHVRAKDSAGNWSVWSTVRTVIILTSIPAAPVLSTPANSLTLNDPTPDFSWGSVAYGNTYELQISKSTTFTTKEQTFIGDVEVRVYTAETLLDGTYYWRVRALNENNTAGAWSAYRSLKVDTTAPAAPILSAPTEAKSVSGTPTFYWLSASTATKYQFEYDNSADFSNPVYTSGELTTLSHKPPTMVPGTYFWHVRAKDSAGNWGGWSAGRSIIIAALAPTTPVLLSPVNGGLSLTPAPVLSWSTSANAADYHLQIDNNSSFSSPEFDITTESGSFNVSGLADGVYYWRVEAVNVVGVKSSWSSVWRFTISFE